VNPSSLAPALVRIRRRRIALITVVALLPLFVVAFLFGPGTRHARELLLLTWVASWAMTTMAVAFSRCPACGQLFHSVLGLDNPLARSCRGCGLALSHTPGPADVR